MGWTGEQAKRQRRKLQRIARQARENPCYDCGVEFPWYIMEFDHCRGEKRNDIAKMVHAPVGVEALMLELQKCDVVCANCHRSRTYERLGFRDAV